MYTYTVNDLMNYLEQFDGDMPIIVHTRIWDERHREWRHEYDSESPQSHLDTISYYDKDHIGYFTRHYCSKKDALKHYYDDQASNRRVYAKLCNDELERSKKADEPFDYSRIPEWKPVPYPKFCEAVVFENTGGWIN